MTFEEKSRRILLVIRDINYSGAAKNFVLLANGLASLGYEVYVYAYECVLPHYSIDCSVRMVLEKRTPKNLIVRRLIPFLRVRRVIKQLKPHVAISFLPYANFFTIVGSFFTNTHVIITERSDPYSENNFRLRIVRWFFRFADGFVFQTEGARSFFGDRIRGKTWIIPNPVDLSEQSALPFEKRQNEIIFVGRFNIKQKRQDLMLEAFEIVLKKYPEMRLVFCGDGGDKRHIEELVAQKGISDRVIFEGKVDEIKDRIIKSKLFVMTSDYEGIPNALLEAMSVGLAVVSTDCSPGGARLLIDHEKNGLIVPVGDSEAVAKAILFLLDNPKISQQYGDEAKRKMAENYSVKTIMKFWDNIIRETLGVVDNSREYTT